MWAAKFHTHTKQPARLYIVLYILTFTFSSVLDPVLTLLSLSTRCDGGGSRIYCTASPTHIMYIVLIMLSSMDEYWIDDIYIYTHIHTHIYICARACVCSVFYTISLIKPKNACCPHMGVGSHTNAYVDAIAKTASIYNSAIFTTTVNWPHLAVARDHSIFGFKSQPQRTYTLRLSVFSSVPPGQGQTSSISVVTSHSITACHVVCNVIYFLSLAQQPSAGQGRLILHVSISHTMTHTSR